MCAAGEVDFSHIDEIEEGQLGPRGPDDDILGIFLNAAFAYDYQREIVWGVPAVTRAQLTNVRLAIDHALHREPALPREEQER